LSYFVKSELNTINDNKEQVDKIKNSLSDRVNVLLANMYNLSISDADGKWRAQLAKELESRVKKRFDELQNPSNCEQTKKILCDLNKACGFGCQVHHVMYCFITAFFTNRMMILESDNWRYNPLGFSAYFKPMSEKCTTTKESAVGWGEHNDESRAIRMPIIDVIANKPHFLPLSVPNEYLDDLRRFHGDPFIWWAGQVLQYLMRFNQDFEAQINDVRRKIGFKAPCVGVHVRRTDKVGTEAAFHAIDEYMPHVDEYFRVQDLINDKQTKRVVYLATDDVQVIKDAKER
jgi:glycoprotein 6-alpha-L-fucosyltransferase